MLKRSLSYLIISVLAKFFAFCLILIVPKFLGPQDFGDSAIYVTAITFISVVISFGTQSIIPKYFYKEEGDELRKAIGSVLVIITVLFTSLLVFLAVIYSVFLYTEHVDVVNIFLVLISAYSLSMINVFLSFYRASEDLFNYAFLELTLALLLFLLPILSIFLLKMDGQGWLISTYLSYVFVAGVGFLKFIKIIKPIFTIQSKRYKEILSLSSPMIPHSIGLLIIASSDKFLVKSILGGATLAIYIIANNFAMIVKIFNDAFMKAWSPFYFKNRNNCGEISRARIQIHSFLVVFVILYNFLCYYTFDYFFDEEFAQAKYLIAPLTFGYFISSFYQVNVPILIDYSKTYILSRITPTCAVLNVVINYFFLKLYGVEVAIVSTIFSYMLLAILVHIFIRKARN